MRNSDGGAWRQRPSQLLHRGREFGVVPEAAWVWPSLASPPELARAFYQHRVACAVREEVGRGATSVQHLAVRLGTSDDQLRRKLAGQRSMPFAEILGLALLLGVQVPPRPLLAARPAAPVDASGCDAE